MAMRLTPVLKRDRALIDELRTRAAAFESEGFGKSTPAALRKAADRIEELSTRKRILTSILTPKDTPNA